MAATSVFGLSEVTSSTELQLLISLVMALLAFGTVALVRRLRRGLVDRYTPIVVDIVSSVLVVGVVVALTLALADMWGHTDTLLEQMGFLRVDERAPEVVVSLVVLIALQVFSGVAARLLDDLTTEQEALTQHQREVALRVTQITLWSVGILLILGIWNVDLTGLLVGAGFLGIVVGLAARETLGSLLGGLVLMFSRPFEVGDWVVIDDKAGIVSDITLMSTRIRAFDGEYVVVPNDVVTNKTITNRSRRERYRVPVEVGVDYETDVERARSALFDAVETVIDEHEFVREAPEPEVVASRFGDSAVVLEVAVWVDAPSARRVMRVRDGLVRTVKDACGEHDITIPFPQRELSGRGGFSNVQLTDGSLEDDQPPSE